MNKLTRTILADVIILYPLVICAGFLEWPVAEFLAFLLNVIAVVCAFIAFYYYEQFFAEMSDEIQKSTSEYLIYTSSTTFVELFVFAYLGWYGLVALWLAIMAAMCQYFFKCQDD